MIYMQNETPGNIILLSGPLGAGKTTIAKELVKDSNNPLVYIEGDKFWFFIVKAFENRSRSKDFKTVMASMLAASIPYANAGYEVIIDFSIPPWFLPTAIKIAGKRDLSIDYIIIRPSEQVCASRAASREEGVVPDYSVYHDFYLSFDEAKKYMIQEDTLSASALALRIRKELAQGLFRVTAWPGLDHPGL
jgi:hypothetical protein